MRRIFPGIACAVALVLAGCKPVTKPPDTPPDQPVDPMTCTPELTLGTPLRLLTRAEYDLTVRDLLGAVNNPARDFPREPLSKGLDNDATINLVTDAHVAAYLDASEFLALDTLTNRRSKIVPCNTTDTACGELFIATTGLRAFRRPLNAEERANLNTLFSTINSMEGFDAAVEVTMQAMLQSPQFLYRDEQALAPVPSPAVTLTGYELASRLSYFLWGTMPDDQLLEAAANGALDTPEGLTAEAKRMLADPKSTDGLMRMFSLWLYLDGVETTEKNTQVYPEFTHDLAKAWRTSLELYVKDVLDHEGTLPALLSTNVMYTNDTMSMYGAPSAPSSTFVRNEMTNGQRAGLLAQPGFLAFKAMPEGSSPVRRGIFVLDDLLCQRPGNPPAGANIVPPAPSNSLTTRERFANHSTSPGCSGCHQFIDPVGFTFEHYDGIGRWRDTENGVAIDATGGVVASDDSSIVGPVDGLAELSQKLAASPRAHDCMSKEFYRFALGRQLTQADACTAAQIGNRFFKSGGNFRELMLAIVESESFRRNANPEMTP
ncbi:MAG: DUF1592 domain-containing protein [Myxococcaceae bacterium]